MNKNNRILNLPNKITVLRVCLIPVFLYFYLDGLLAEGLNELVSLILFGFASATDALDGYIARRRKMITNFGKLMDPLADKLLVSAALIAMAVTGAVPAWAVIVLISREFYISGFRQLALEQGLVLAASFWAKVKTIVQMIMILFLLLPLPAFLPDIVFIWAEIIKWVLIMASVVLSIFSAVEYSVKNKQVFK
jgi:CDP-diacylglycerol--glycerol-3-phosphate 3-phosphatidyltransferase